MNFRSIQSYLRLKKIKSFKTSKDKNVVKLFAHVRNEIQRLPFFLKYYRAMGVREFFFVDNSSTDDTAAYLTEQNDVHLFKTSEAFSKAEQGTLWLNILMKRFAMGQWCLCADADEIFVYPYCETVSLQELCHFLDENHASAMQSTFLDFYSKNPIIDSAYESGVSPLKQFSYFDLMHRNRDSGYDGGTQKRMIGHQKMVWKCPLIKVAKKRYLKSGHHAAVHADYAHVNGCVLHFPYDSGFKEKCDAESLREEYANNASKYKAYHELFQKNEKLSFFHQASLKFENTHQLLELALMKSDSSFEAYVKSNSNSQRQEASMLLQDI